MAAEVRGTTWKTFCCPFTGLRSVGYDKTGEYKYIEGVRGIPLLSPVSLSSNDFIDLKATARLRDKMAVTPTRVGRASKQL